MTTLNGKRAKQLRRIAHKGNDISHRTRDLRAIEHTKTITIKDKESGDGKPITITQLQAVDVGPRGEYLRTKDEFKRLRRVKG